VPNQRNRPFQIYPIQKVDVYDTVLDQLSQVVTALDPGSRLPSERDLAGELKVSRVSVREALRALESMGRIEIRPNSGSFVLEPESNKMVSALRGPRTVDMTFLDELVDVRSAIEDRVVVLICSDPSIDLTSVKELVDRLESEFQEPDIELGSLDLRFETALGRLTDNRLLAELQRAIHQLWIEAWSICGIAPGDRWLFHTQHVEILQAMLEGDESTARERMAEHVDRAVLEAQEIQLAASTERLLGI